MNRPKRPNSRVNLDKAIERAFGREDAALRARTIIADVVVAQMLPGGVVKGGSSLKMRYGGRATRFTKDLDAARQGDIESFLDELDESLSKGWEGFTGRIVERKPATPEGIPASYVMRPFDIKLAYESKPWTTVRLEVGHNEIGDADSFDLAMSSEIVDMFRAVGLPDPAPVVLMKTHYQIAQKLHGLTEPGSRRAHDLIDLQIIAQEEEIDAPLIKQTCERLFAYRKIQKWPPTVVEGNDWETLYLAQNPPESICQEVGGAIEWCNRFIVALAGCQD